MCDLRNNRIVGRGTSFAKITLRLQEAFTTRAPRVRIVELFSPCLHACRLLSGNKKALTGEPAKACEVRCLFAFNQRNNYSIYGRYTQGRETGAKRAFFGLFLSLHSCPQVCGTILHPLPDSRRGRQVCFFHRGKHYAFCSRFVNMQGNNAPIYAAFMLCMVLHLYGVPLPELQLRQQGFYNILFGSFCGILNVSLRHVGRYCVAS